MNIRTRKKETMSKKSQKNMGGLAKIAVVSFSQHNTAKNAAVSGKIQPPSSFWKKLTLFKLRPTTKFQIIIFSYWLQWTPPCNF